MKLCISISCVLAGCLAAAPAVCAQQQSPGNSQQSTQNPPANSQQKPAQKNSQPNSNAFPEDTSNVPLLPDGRSNSAPDIPPDVAGPAVLPARDSDPARSPDDGETTTAASSSESTSDVPGIDSMMPKPDEDRRTKKEAPEYHETAADDINVAKYYIERKDWKAAQSRFQSAMVLTPEDPDIYWGLAECARHLGDFATARVNYLKVMEYDPDSKRSKEAEKALKDPEIAKAQTPTPTAQPQK
jgi:tetratricopeptide (TPR) repeat protein